MKSWIQISVASSNTQATPHQTHDRSPSWAASFGTSTSTSNAGSALSAHEKPCTPGFRYACRLYEIPVADWWILLPREGIIMFHTQRGRCNMLRNGSCAWCTRATSKHNTQEHSPLCFSRPGVSGGLADPERWGMGGGMLCLSHEI